MSAAGLWWLTVGILALPLGNVPVPGLGTTLMLPALLLSVSGCACTLVAERRPLLVYSPLVAAGWAFVATLLVATVVATAPLAALRIDVACGAGLAWCALLVACAPSLRQLRTLTTALALVTATVAVVSLSTWSTPQQVVGGALVDGRLRGVFGQPNELGSFAAMTLPVSTAMLLGRRGKWRVLGAIACVAGACALALSLSRSSWIGAAVGLAVLAVLLPPARRWIAAAVPVLGVTCAALWYARPDTGVLGVLVARMRTFARPESNPDDDRPAIWHEAARQITDRPVLGSGPGGYPRLARASTSYNNVGGTPLHAHNLVLTIAAEQGLLGVAALSAMAVVAVITIRRARRCRHVLSRLPGSAALLAGPAAGLAGMVAEGSVDYPLRNDVLLSLVWLLLGLLAATAMTLTARPAGTYSAARGTTVTRKRVLDRWEMP